MTMLQYACLEYAGLGCVLALCCTTFCLDREQAELPTGPPAEGSLWWDPMRVCREARTLVINNSRGAMDNLAPKKEEHVARV